MAQSSSTRYGLGAASGIFSDKNDILSVADLQSNDTRNQGFRQGIGSGRDGIVREFIPWHETGAPEGVAADDGNVYAGYNNTLNFRRFFKR